MRLQAQLPARMLEAILDGETCILSEVRTVERLQEEVLEGEILDRKSVV